VGERGKESDPPIVVRDAAEENVEHDTEWVADNWKAITSMESPFIMWNLGETRDDHLAARAAAKQG
jgi:hypothetical protein